MMILVIPSKQQKGLRSPLLFNIVVDRLPILIARAKETRQIAGVVPHLVDEGLSIIHFAYVTIVFMGHDFEQAKKI